MNEKGWIKLHRKVLDNPVVCRDSDHLAIWIYLLLNATHEDYETWFGGKKITLHPGQLVTGRKIIAKTLRISEAKTQRVLTCLENEHQIEQQTTTKGRVISLLNWSRYQDAEQQTEQQVNNKRTTTEQQVNTIQEHKNIEQKKEVPLGEVLLAWNSLPEPIPKVSKIVTGSSRDKKLRKRIADFGIEEVKRAIDNIRDSDFLQGNNKRGWTVTFDWFLGPENFQKVLDGNYADKKSASGSEEWQMAHQVLTKEDIELYG